MELEEEFALQCVALLSVDLNKGIPEAASLFELHLKIDPVSLFESEGSNQSCVAEHSYANMIT